MRIQSHYHSGITFDLKIEDGEDIIDLREFIEGHFQIQVDSIILVNSMEHKGFTILTLTAATKQEK